MTPTKKYSDSPEDAFRRITRGLIAWRESTTVAMALIYEAIEREIWKLKYDSKKEYFELECKITEQWGHELYAASKAIEGLKSLESKSGNSLGFLQELNAWNVGPVKNETPEKAAEILTRAKKKRGKKKVTRQAVQEAKDEYEMQEPKEMQEPAEPEVVRDETGVPIPPIPLAYWNRRQEVKDMLKAVSAIKCQIEKARETEDPLWMGVSQHVISELELCYSYVKDAMPYSLCTICNGYPKEVKCEYCAGMGILSKRRYGGTDDRIRAIREKAHAQFVGK